MGTGTTQMGFERSTLPRCYSSNNAARTRKRKRTRRKSTLVWDGGTNVGCYTSRGIRYDEVSLFQKLRNVLDSLVTEGSMLSLTDTLLFLCPSHMN